MSTGPGALTSLAGLQEAYATSVPMVVISSQIPRAGLGGRRKGFLHQLDDQRQSAQNVTKSTGTVEHPAGIAPAIGQAWRTALTAPQGPCNEITQDTLLEPTSLPGVADVDGSASPLPRVPSCSTRRLLRWRRPSARSSWPAVGWRAGAEAELAAVARRSAPRWPAPRAARAPRLGPSAVRAIVGGGRGDHRAAGRRRRLAGDRLVPAK